MMHKQSSSTAFSTHLKRGDDVIVIAGKDKGMRGKILQMHTKTSRVTVEGVGSVKRHMKASVNSEAGVTTKNMPIHISNVMLADPKTGNPTRVGYTLDKDNRKRRVAKKSGEVIAEGTSETSGATKKAGFKAKSKDKE